LFFGGDVVEAAFGYVGCGLCVRAGGVELGVGEPPELALVAGALSSPTATPTT
jgi:hypothetical protein